MKVTYDDLIIAIFWFSLLAMIFTFVILMSIITGLATSN